MWFIIRLILINSNWKPPWFDFGFENLARWSKDAINWPYGKAKNHKELLNTAHMCVFFVKSFLNSFQEVESTWNDHWHQSTPKIGFCKWKESKCYILVVVTLSGILKAKQKLGITFNSGKLGLILQNFQHWPCAVPRRKPRPWLF